MIRIVTMHDHVVWYQRYKEIIPTFYWKRLDRLKWVSFINGWDGRWLKWNDTWKSWIPYWPVKNTSFEVPERNWRKRVPNLSVANFTKRICRRDSAAPRFGHAEHDHIWARLSHNSASWLTWKKHWDPTYLRTSTLHPIKNKTQTKTSTMSTSFRFVSNQSLRKGAERKASFSGIAAMTSELQFVLALRNHWSELSFRKFPTKKHASCESCVIHHLFLYVSLASLNLLETRTSSASPSHAMSQVSSLASKPGQKSMKARRFRTLLSSWQKKPNTKDIKGQTWKTTT